MARTIFDLSTMLSDQEVEAKLAAFLLNNKFQKVYFRGEELYRVGALLMRPGYLKIYCGGGRVHIEAFYVDRRGDLEIDSYFDPHDLRKKLLPLLLELGFNQAGSEFQDTMLKTSAGHGCNGFAQTGYAADPAVEERRAERKKKVKKGCLTALIIFLALLGGCTALVMLYPSPEEEASRISPSADTTDWVISDNDGMSFLHPADWIYGEYIDYLEYSQNRSIRFDIDFDPIPKKEDEIDVFMDFILKAEAAAIENKDENFFRNNHLPGNMTDAKKISFEQGKINDRTAINLVYDGKRDGEDNTYQLILINADGSIMFFRYTWKTAFMKNTDLCSR